jgi:fructokinase
MRIGIDLGGTKIEAIALGDDGTELARTRIATPPGYRETIAAIVDVVTTLENDAAARLTADVGTRATVGVGMPGVVSPLTGLVKNANSTWLIGEPFDRDLSRALGREVRCANDANCLALSEAVDGAGAGERVVFAVILGTGVGAGIVVDGEIVAGRHGTGGEWGHNPLPWAEADELPGPACYCGRRGCIETWVSGPALARDHEQVTGVTADPPSIVAAAERGDADAEATMKRYEQRLARSLGHVVNILDPDVIVVGGGVSKITRLYANVPHLLPRWVFGGEAETPIRPARHGDTSGFRGAAWLWPESP